MLSSKSNTGTGTAGTGTKNNTKTTIAVPTRGIQVVEGHSPCFAAGLHVLCFLLTPIRKALVHFYLTCRNQPLEQEQQQPAEWKLLSSLGKLFQELMLPQQNNSSDDDKPVDPTDFYQLMKPLLRIQEPPKDATQALQLLLELLQTCVTKIPVTRQLWNALLDMAGLGLIAKQATIGKQLLPTTKGSSEHMIQRTKRDTCIMYCPFPLIDRFDTLHGGLENTIKQNNLDYNWDAKPDDYDFEVKIPLLAQSSSSPMTMTPEKKWTTTKTLQFSTLPAFLFLGVNRFDAEGELVNPAIEIPKELDVTKYCAPGTLTSANGNMAKYALVGGILYDEEDYVAILKNPNYNSTSEDEDENGDQEEEEIENWNLLETEEVIPMTETDVMGFLKGEEGGVCGTVLVYSTLHQPSHTEMNQLLSDIIISHVSGKLDSKADFFYYEEEEWIEEEIIED
jgi:hypothetical protein